MPRTLRELLKKQFPADGLGWKIPSFVAAPIAIVGGVVAVAVWASDALADFLTADVEVWHLLLAIGAQILGGLGVAVVVKRRSGSRQRRVNRSRYAPKEVERYDVLWPISAHWYEEPEFSAGKPRCPKCRTPLGFDFGEGSEPFSLPGDWKDTPSKGMTFRCPKDVSAYDLTKYNIPMLLMPKHVEDLASGQYETALREAGQ